MRTLSLAMAAIAFAAHACLCRASTVEEVVVPGVTVIHGAVNGALLPRGTKTLAVYGDPRDAPPPADTVLFTHHRRDLVWAGRELVERGARAIVPAEEERLFAGPEEFWAQRTRAMFHDYAVQGTKIATAKMAVTRAVRDGEILEWEGLSIRVMATPGYTRGAVSYLVEMGGKKIAFTGDLILGDGSLADIYSLQDAIPAAKIGGYHGYAARLADVLASLRRIAAEKPDTLVPARGAVIANPAAAIDALRGRIEALYANYLSIDALRWYFGEDHIMSKARRVLGPEAHIDWMPMAAQAPLPPWIAAIGNSRLIVSATGAGFLVDCGGAYVIEELRKRRTAGTLAQLEHVFITHYHDDHTDQVPALVAEFGCMVHATSEMRDILERPAAYRMPCLTAHPIHVSGLDAHGASWRWQEFEMTPYFFPGQTRYHDALLVKKASGETFFFIGDSFTPGGIDDYCLPNRNFLRPGTGFFACVDLIERAAPDAFLINQHVEPAFRFSPAQLVRMRSTLARRLELLAPLFPWDDPNWGTDENWACLYPYATEARPGASCVCQVIITNHSPSARVFEVRPRLPADWTVEAMVPTRLRIPARHEGSMKLVLRPPLGAPAGLHVITVDLRSDNVDLREWCECLVTIPEAPAVCEWITVGTDGRSFMRAASGAPFVPWGFNYDHDRTGRLIEDYWDKEWTAVVEDFQEMRRLGANTVRIHLQLGKFMAGPTEANAAALERLGRLLALAEHTGLYLDLTGLACYHKRDVPAWYDSLAEKERWGVQARFWDAVARRCADSPAIFCYDLMNEPVAPAGGPRKDWLGPPFGDKHFVQFIGLDQAGRERAAIAREWIATLVAAIRARDSRRLITVGLVPWSLDRPGLTSGFVPARIADLLDFVSVHIYPEKDKRAEALETLRGFAIGKPILIEEMFPLSCSPEELEAFIDASRSTAAGWLGFYWGATPDELKASGTIADALTRGWLDLFVRKAPARVTPISR